MLPVSYIFWNFLDDLYYFFNSKVSPNDSRYIKTKKLSELQIKPHVNIILNDQEPENSMICPQKYIKPSSYNLKTEEKVHEIYESNENTLKTPPKALKTPPRRDSYRAINQERQALLHQELSKRRYSRGLSFYSAFTPEKTSRRTSLDPLRNSQNKSPSLKTKVFVNEETKVSIRIWLKELGFRGYILEKDERNLLLDPYRNGVLLYTILGVLGYDTNGFGVYKKPGILEEIRENWRNSWEIMKKNSLETAFEGFFIDIDDFIKGDSSIIFEVLNQLKNLKINGNIVRSVPYSQEEFSSLEKTLVVFLKDLELFEEITLENIYKGMKTGVLFCEIVGKMLKIPKETMFCFKNPKNSGQNLMNINKALEMLRKQAKEKIGQKFLWRAKEILMGEKVVILGILEDICRFSLGFPGRNGPNYFADGPISEDILEKRKIFHKKEVLLNKGKSSIYTQDNGFGMDTKDDGGSFALNNRDNGTCDINNRETAIYNINNVTPNRNLRENGTFIANNKENSSFINVENIFKIQDFRNNTIDNGINSINNKEKKIRNGNYAVENKENRRCYNVNNEKMYSFFANKPENSFILHEYNK